MFAQGQHAKAKANPLLEWFDRVGYEVDIPGLAHKYGLRLTTLAEWARRANWH